MTDLDSQTAGNIQKAHQIAGKPAGFSDLPFPSLRHLLETRLRERGKELFLHYADDSKGEERRFTYEEFGTAVGRAAQLLQKYGIGRGSTVATLAHNHWQTVVQYFACWALGARVTPLVAPDLKNTAPSYRKECLEDWSFKIDNAEATILLARAEYYGWAKELKDACKGLSAIVPVGGEVEGAPEEFFLASQGLPGDLSLGEPPQPEDRALIVYTSGTTGKPKGVDLSQCHLLYDAVGIGSWCDTSAEEGGHRFMCVLPIHHVNGTVVTLVTPLYTGGSVLLNRAFKPDSFWKRLADGEVQTVSVVPTLLHTLLERREDLAAYDLSNLERIICGAGPLSVKLAQEFSEAFGFAIAHGYGLSETTCYSCGLPDGITKKLYEEVMHGWGFPSIGVPIAQNEMAILDPQGNPVPASPSPKDLRNGEICIRGQNVMNGYFKRPDANKSAFEHGWFHSGDEGFWIERQGEPYFFITGRLKELIIRGGVNISPYEIDEVLQAIPGVVKALAVAVPSKHYSEEVGAYIQTDGKTSLNAKEVLKTCYQNLGFSKCPKFVFFAHEVGVDVPYTTTAKPQRIFLEEKLKEKGLFGPVEDIQIREADFKKEIGL